MDPFKTLASGWPRIFTVLAIGAGVFTVMLLTSPNPPTENSPLVKNVTFEGAGAGFLLVIIFAAYLLGEGCLQAGLLMFGPNDETRRAQLVTVALLENDIITAEYQRVAQLIELKCGTGGAAIIAIICSFGISWPNISTTGWIVTGLALFVTFTMWFFAREDSRQFGYLLEEYATVVRSQTPKESNKT